MAGHRLRLVPPHVRGRHLAALRPGRRARPDPPRPRPARGHPPRAPGGGRGRAQRHRRRRGDDRARPGQPQGHPGRLRPADLADRFLGGGDRAGSREGHARPGPGLLPHRLGGARRRRGQAAGPDDRPLPAPGQGADRPGGDPHPRAARQRARRRRAIDRGTGQPRGPDPRAASGRHRRRPGQARHQDHRPALAQARRDLRGHAGDAPPGRRGQGPGQHGHGQRARATRRASPPTTSCARRP